MHTTVPSKNQMPEDNSEQMGIKAFKIQKSTHNLQIGFRRLHQSSATPTPERMDSCTSDKNRDIIMPSTALNASPSCLA